MDTARRKSCDACVRSKRRCGLGRPKCRRCISRNIDCVYPDFILARTSSDAGPTSASGNHDAAVIVDDFAFGLQLPADADESTSSPSPFMNGTWFEFCNEPFNLPSLSNDDLCGLQAMGKTVSQPSHASIENIDRTSEVQFRSEFVSKRFAKIPKSFVEQAQTSFIHRCLLQAHPDPALQDALSTSALYFLRTDSNRLLAIRNLEHKARYLVETTNPHVMTRTSLLETTQALLLYQLIRLFDGDIRLRAQAEADETCLTECTNQLRSCMRPITPNTASSALDASQSSSIVNLDWQAWLIEESIRRTVIMALMLKGIYNFLKTGRDSEQDLLRLSFNARASLWSAQTQQTWLAKRQNTQGLEVRVVHWNEDIGRATPEDLDELGVQLMTMLWGVDATAQWLGRNHVVKHGFESI